MVYNIIASINQFNIIGVNDKLLIKCKEDLEYFKKITTDIYPEGPTNVILMGYNTWISLPTVLPNRINVILTKNHTIEESDDIKVFNGLDKAFEWYKSSQPGRLFIIGGSEIFNECLKKYKDQLNHVYITEFYSDYTHRTPESKLFPYELILDLPQRKVISKESSGKIYVQNKDTYVDTYLKYRFIDLHNKKYLNKEEYQYIEGLTHILQKGSMVKSRNANVTSVFGLRMEYDLQKGFPLLTTKQMPFKTILRELLWFIKGSTNNKELQDKNVHIWDQNSSKDFLSNNGLPYEEGDLGPIYGFQWRHMGAEYKDCHTDYTDKGIDQLKYIIWQIKENPSSRRIIMSAWNPMDIHKMALPPCHVMIQFHVNQDKQELDAQMYQRSGDMFLGVPFNIASYAILIHIIANITGYKPGKFIHIIGDAHIYESHMVAVQEQIEREPVLFPKLHIKKKINEIDEINESLFILQDYYFYPKISAPMIA